jgi:putative transposase
MIPRWVVKGKAVDPSPRESLPSGARHRWNPARNWQRFIDTHMSSLLGCDFACIRMLTWRGWVDAFIFVVIHLESRKVYISPATFNPNHLWLAQQVRNTAMWCEDEGIEARYLIRDNDAKFGNVFDHTTESVGPKIVKTCPMTPNMNPHVESFIGNTRRECLNHLVFFTLPQLDRALAAWRFHYLAERPHQGRGIDNNVLDKDFVPQVFGEIRCQRTLGGLFKSYHRSVA